VQRVDQNAEAAAINAKRKHGHDQNCKVLIYMVVIVSECWRTKGYHPGCGDQIVLIVWLCHSARRLGPPSIRCHCERSTNAQLNARP
jgi:hypothetical protein